MEIQHAAQLAQKDKEIERLKKECKRLEAEQKKELYKQVKDDNSKFFELPEVRPYLNDTEVNFNQVLQSCISQFQENQIAKMIFIYQVQNWSRAKNVNHQIKEILENSLVEQIENSYGFDDDDFITDQP